MDRAAPITSLGPGLQEQKSKLQEKWVVQPLNAVAREEGSLLPTEPSSSSPMPAGLAGMMGSVCQVPRGPMSGSSEGGSTGERLRGIGKSPWTGKECSPLRANPAKPGAGWKGEAASPAGPGKRSGSKPLSAGLPRGALAQPLPQASNAAVLCVPAETLHREQSLLCSLVQSMKTEYRPLSESHRQSVGMGAQAPKTTKSQNQG